MYIVFVILFFVSTLLNYIFEMMHRNLARDICKLLIVPSILLFYIFYEANPSIILIVAYLIVIVGDIILNFKGKNILIAGGIAFLLSNIAFVIHFIVNSDYKVLAWFCYLEALAMPLCIYIISYYFLNKKLSTNLKPLAYIYLGFNVLIVASTILYCYSLNSVLPFIGALLYFISDTCLLLGRSDKNAQRITRHLVIPFYALGMFLLCLGGLF